MDVAEWLQALGLAHYEVAFREHRVGADLLFHLTAEDLKELGVATVGDRRRLLSAIAELNATAPQVVTRNSHNRPAAPAAERRQITVLFCDIVGSTPLSVGLDPEDLRAVLSAYQASVVSVIAGQRGYIAGLFGDGVLGYFGWPNADEAHAESAVRAGLAIIEAISPQQLSVRIGIATGLVVTGNLAAAGAAQAMTAVGETPNLASRLQDLAQPNTVILSEATRSLLGQMYELQDLGLITLKGFVAPVRAWRALGETDVESRSEVVYVSALTPLVNRSHELRLLLEKWQEAKVGGGRLVLLSGEPGIGKSRLLAALEETLAAEPHLSLRYFCSQLYQDTALHPVISRWKREAGFVRNDSAEQRLRKLEAVLDPLELQPEDSALIASLLSIPTGDDYPRIDLTPEQRKRRTFAALFRTLSARARKKPLLVLFEDAHWSDPSSLELLDMIVDRLPELPILLAVSYRPEFVAPWIAGANATPVTLRPLNRSESAMLAAQVASSASLSSTIFDRIVMQADGVPLFIEELTKAMQEARSAGETGGTPMDSVGQPSITVPATLTASLMARLDRLGSTKEVAQLGAVIGRTFDHELLATVSERTESNLKAELRRLVEAGLVSRQGAPPNVEYTFRHALVQETAYESLLRSRRQVYHRQVAQALERRFSDTVEEQPQLVAHHYTESDAKDNALPYWQAAAQKATQRSANAEAVNHLTRALRLLDAMPETPERRNHELGLQLALGTPLIAARGFASPEVGAVYARARELCHGVGDAPQLFPVLWGLWVFYTARAQHRTAMELAGHCHRLAQASNDPDLLIGSHHALGVTLLALGDFAAGLKHLEQAISSHDPHRHAKMAFVYGQDAGVVCRAHAAWALWFLGHPDQAIKKGDEALRLAQELSHPYSLVVTLNFLAWIHQLVRNPSLTSKWAEAASKVAIQHDFAFWIPMGTILEGGALTTMGHPENGGARIRDGLNAFHSMGAEIFRPYYLTLLAEAVAEEGNFQNGLSILAEAQVVIDGSGECWWEAEVHRLKGDLLSKQLVSLVDHSEAEQCFEQARSIAVVQNAKSLELRATINLAQLWRERGKVDDSRRLLSEIYHRFEEGFATADLLAAKALISEL